MILATIKPATVLVRMGLQARSAGYRVAIIGAGSARLSAAARAAHLRRDAT
jgi:hypothetical protein